MFSFRPDQLVGLRRAAERRALADPEVKAGRRTLRAAIDASALNRDFSQPYVHNDSVEAAFVDIYRHTEQHWELYEMAEELVDLEDYFRQWRFRHMTTVERVIGFKRGTGGTAGVAYLRKMLEVVLFPELWSVRTAM